MVNRIPKFHEVIERFYSDGLFRGSKDPLPRKGQSLEQRKRREQAMVDAILQQLGGGADDSPLTWVLNNLRDLHQHFGFVALFPDKELCGTQFYFWLIVWPQLELMFEDVLQSPQGSVPLRYLADCYKQHGAMLFGDRVASRKAILAMLDEPLRQALSDSRINRQRAVAAQAQVLKTLGRLIRHDSFPSTTSVNAPLTELKQALGHPSRQVEAISEHLLQLLQGARVVHAAGASPLFTAQRPALSDEIREIHRLLYQHARSQTEAGARAPRQLLENLVCEFKTQIKHTEPDTFLSRLARQVGSTAATQALIRHNAGQFHAYVLLEQIKSDLGVGQRLQRVNFSVQALSRLVGGEEKGWLAFFAEMPLPLFLLNAIFSSALSLIRNGGDDSAFVEALSVLKSLGGVAQADESQRQALLAVVAREQIRVLKKMLDVYHGEHHLGRLAVEILAFLYAFKYKYDPGFQPHATDKLESILDDCVDPRDIRYRIAYETPFGGCGRTLIPAGTGAALIMIHHYNRYVLSFCERPVEYLCNPLQRLNELLQRVLTSANADGAIEDATLKRRVNAEFGTGKNKSVMRIGGIRPYECLRDIGFYLSALHLQKQEVLNPGLFLYLALPRASQRLILQLLSPASYTEDFTRQHSAPPVPTEAKGQG